MKPTGTTGAWRQAQVSLNRRSAGKWQDYREHRERVTTLIVGLAPPHTGRLVVLGAGNCNDLSLATVAATYDQVHLVDIDGDAVRDAITRQHLAHLPQLRVHDLDITRLGDQGPAEVPGPADVVVSAAVLSQLISSQRNRGGQAQDLLAVRDAHLRTMLHLLKPGGTALLINDVVSSDTCPELGDLPEEQLPDLLTRLLDAGNFFTGCNPAAIAATLQRDPGVRAGGVKVARPWRWRIGDRFYLVCALVFHRPAPIRFRVTATLPVKRTRAAGTGADAEQVS